MNRRDQQIDLMYDAASLLRFLKARCRIIYYPPNNEYPIEHAPLARKDQWGALVAAWKKENETGRISGR